MAGKCWEQYGSGWASVASAEDRLPAGVYWNYESSARGLIFEPLSQKGDDVLDLPGLPNDFISDQIDLFWKQREVYHKYKFSHKRGIMMYGPPGNGKSCVITGLIKNLIKEDGIVLKVNKFSTSSQALTLLKSIEPERKVMTLMEDMDTLLSGDYKTEEPYALSMLDGQDQVDGVVHVATTNYPEQLADRFIKRPGRFDLILGIGHPVEETRRAYFEHLLGKQHKEIDTLVAKTEGLSLAYLREIASTYLCLGIPLEDTISRLKKNFSTKLKSNGNSVGFTVGYHEPTE